MQDVVVVVGVVADVVVVEGGGVGIGIGVGVGAGVLGSMDRRLRWPEEAEQTQWIDASSKHDG